LASGCVTIKVKFAEGALTLGSEQWCVLLLETQIGEEEKEGNSASFLYNITFLIFINFRYW